MSERELISNVRVRVTGPTPEHQPYMNETGRIVDVRDFEHRFCLVELDGRVDQAIWFDEAELEVI
jgi:hypothetical protein